MRSYLPDYELVTPANLSEALALLARQPGAWKPFAGGTDLMVLLEAGKLPHKKFFSLWHLEELKDIAVADDAVVLGALTTYTEVLNHPVLQKEFPLLCQAARQTGGVATQNRGTLGGNIANASPAADSSPALLVYDAELELVSARGTRSLPYHRFHLGYKVMDLQPDELIRAIRLPRVHKPRVQYYRKVGTRRAQAISKVVFAGVAEMAGGGVRDVRIALGSVAPTVLRCGQTEEAVRGQRIDSQTIKRAQAALAGEIAPIDDIRSTRRYRRQVSLRLLADFLQRCAGSVQG
ncbi:MAG TPA: xanthine dehydrogenase family protein subunit M [Candidatus Xenobia bacterium]|nr:xanthine dehydrogenase family protein subunit M [Candidatus Xenobia bacterium]